MKKTVISSAVAALLAGSAMAQTPSLEQVQKDLSELKAQNDRLQAEVDYLKENAKAERKDLANKTVALDNVSAAVSKYTWSGDFRFRDEQITTAANNTAEEHTRSRDRIRLRFGVLAKVNDTINAKLQISTTNSGNDNARSTNQTLGNGTAGNGPWDRKPLSIDQAYVDWKALSFLNVQLGKTPIPWATTASYFWDKDLTPEGVALKFSRGIFFGGAYYDWLNERHINFLDASQPGNTDARIVGAQAGLKLPIAKTSLTAAVGYFDVTNVKDRSVTATTGTGLTCSADNAFNGSGNGNSTYSGTGAAVGDPANTCTRLVSDFNVVTALVQFDFNLGKFPVTAFVDYMLNNSALANPVVNKKLDDALAIGLTFNKASAPKSWEVGVLYQETGKDAVYGQFVDSDFGGGVTDVKGWALKGAYVPLTNFTLNATYFINQQNIDGVLATANTRDLDYKRLQLDLNYKF